MKKNIKIITTIGFLLLLTVSSFFLFRNQGQILKNVFKKFNLIPIKEAYTELYFENYSYLPKISYKDQQLNFTFTIHNVEWKEMSYDYVVYFQYRDGSKVYFKNGKITIPDGVYRSINVKYVFLNDNLSGRVVVELLGKGQYIDFILPNYN